MAVRIQLRHDTISRWEEHNPILLEGEVGVVTDEHKRFKIGNGKLTWKELPYADVETVHTFGDEHISGLKTFIDNIVIGSTETPSTLTVYGDIDGVISKAKADEYDNNIFEYYQRKLANTSAVDINTDWNTLIEEGVYNIDITNNAWGVESIANQPTSYSKNISSTGLLIVHAFDESNIIQIYYPLCKKNINMEMTVVYRTFYRSIEDGLEAWTEWATLTSNDKDVVHAHEDETIDGVKTFISDTVFNSSIIVNDVENGIKLNNNTSIRKDVNDNLYISTNDNNIYIRPHGDNNDTNQIIIDTDGVINGKCLKDSNGNIIKDTYINKEELELEVLSVLAKEHTYISATQDSITYNNLIDLLEDENTYEGMDIYLFPDNILINDTLTLYKYQYVTDTETFDIFTDSNTEPAHLFNTDGSVYTGSEFIIDVTGEAPVVRYGENACVVTEDVLTISDELILNESGTVENFTNASYIKKELLLEDNYRLTIPIKFNEDSIDVNQGIAVLRAEDNSDIFKIDYIDGNINLKGYGELIDYGITFDIQQPLYIRISKDGNTYSLDYSQDNELWLNVQQYEIPTEDIKNINTIVVGTSGLDNNPLKGIIDLNLLVVFIEDIISYIPCINIPYSYTNKGIKIVDSKYNQRLSNLIDKYHTANYFLLNRENEQFKFPYDSLDGYCHTLRHWRKGAESCEYNTDLECTQTGQATSGIAVVFKKPFADDNYYLSIACSSKDRFGFTPSEDNIYYAKGRIYLE